MNDTMNKVKVFIAGKSYVLQTDEEERYVLNLARQVDKGIKDMMQGDSTMSMPDACILFADETCWTKRRSPAPAVIICAIKSRITSTRPTVPTRVRMNCRSKLKFWKTRRRHCKTNCRFTL